VHFVEDLHMPLHVGENHDRAGNDLQLRWYDRGSNLHRVWDSGIIDHVGRGEDGWLADLVAMDPTRPAPTPGRAPSVTRSLIGVAWAFAMVDCRPGFKLGYGGCGHEMGPAELHHPGQHLPGHWVHALLASRDQGVG
jgi:hypothetical protein